MRPRTGLARLVEPHREAVTELLQRAPLIGIPQVKHQKVLWRVVISLDHVLYGVVATGRRCRRTRSPSARTVSRAGCAGRPRDGFPRYV
ncbi:hypothetical protein STVIR_7700 [Streptomyces viridochromogenes Tue57]|uniref:Uncharacterized protein n=1 Tax=Streptomyces viridochromogenes Tue57 TaxID=1160705 RepID=L8P575_STRVR|nr:hypothetical protein STVIR_7700 [Streptomyces viridochromogenes Tue57]